MKKRKALQFVLIILLFLIIGFFTGYFLADSILYLKKTGYTTGEILLSLGGILLILFMSVLLQIILHEAGHLLFGWISGYRFLSFRIGSFMWLKKDGGIRFARLKIAGTGGQCLMGPPDLTEGKFPYILYNLGGSIINLLSAPIFLMLLFLLASGPFLSVFLILAAAIGIVFALMNGIPLKLAQVNNDGYNVLSLGKNPEALKAFWLQLKVTEQMTKGVRLKDMPDEWFAMPSDKAMKNGIIAAVGVFACNRLMDAMELEKADDTIAELLQMDTGINELHRRLLIVDQVYCELVGKNRQERLSRLLTKQQIRFMKSMKTFPSVLRTEYTYALLKENDNKKASKIKDEFEKMGAYYPYPQEIESERELMELAEQKSLI
ncbi:MAG: M50 family metallopeptidase [Clostridiales bacterium]|jgi:hypothetical protein|nr:M50 family metallopeptidase [Clostridiales bacterium]